MRGIPFNPNRFTPDPKPDKAIKPKKAYKFKKEATGEGIVFKQIASTRKHVSFVSGDEIKNLTHANMAHVLPKAANKYPLFKLYPKNIQILTFDEHFLWDNKRESLRDKPQWEKMFLLEEELKEEYKLKTTKS